MKDYNVYCKVLSHYIQYEVHCATDYRSMELPKKKKNVILETFEI